MKDASGKIFLVTTSYLRDEKKPIKIELHHCFYR